MLSLISSLSPPVFGIRDGVNPIPHTEAAAAAPQTPSTVEVEVFSNAHTTLPEVLRKQGYRTVGISTNGHLIERQG
jgi:hypothetical protein